MYDVQAIRRDFPILAREVAGKPLAYLDNGATAQKPRAVIDAISAYYEGYNSNVHRGVHTLSMEATDAYEAARDKVARFIHAPSSGEVIFTRGTTEAINLVAASWGRSQLRPGDEIVITHMEHHSNIVPWQLLAAETGATVRVVPVGDDGRLDLDAYRAMLGERTRIVAFVHMSNVVGTINPARDMIDLAHDAGAITVVDGAQSVPHLPTDVQALDCDFLAFSGHKMCGPTGIGVLYGKRELLDAMPPYQGGGDMIRTVRLDGSTWNDLPHKFEAGTPHIAGAIALGAAVDYLEDIGMEAVRRHEAELTRYALDRLLAIEGLRLYGPADVAERGGVVSFCLGDLHPHDLGTVLDQEGVAVRAGHHCAQPLMERYGVPAMTRASLYLYNTEDEIDRLEAGIRKAQRFFTRTPVSTT